MFETLLIIKPMEDIGLQLDKAPMAHAISPFMITPYLNNLSMGKPEHNTGEHVPYSLRTNWVQETRSAA